MRSQANAQTIVMAILLLLLLICQIKAHDLNVQRKLQATSCPRVVFSESYNFALSSTSTITPAFTLSCSGSTFIVRSGYTYSTSGLSFNASTRAIRVSDWSQFQTGGFYNITFQFEASTSTQSSTAQFSDYFMFTVGAQKIQYNPIGTRLLQYWQDIALTYPGAFDPQQPESGVIQLSYTCNSILTSCSSLSNINQITRIRTNWAYEYDYKINVTLANKASGFAKSSIDQVTMRISAPENSGTTPLSCVDFALNFRNLNYTVNRLSYTESSIIYDDLNFTEFRMTAPTVDIQKCQSSSSNIGYFASVNQNNPLLFNDPRTFVFNTTDVVISRQQLSSVLMVNKQTSFQIYVIVYNIDLSMVIGYYRHIVTLVKGAQTLYALTTSSFIQVDPDKILYIDSSPSYDTLNSNVNYNYIWTLKNYAGTLPNSKTLTLTPTQRSQMGINQAGKYFVYTLQITDSTRQSNIAQITVQITPGLDPQGCYQVALKDIDVETIITYTIFPLLLQARTIKNPSCTNIVANALIWECQTVDWQFWSIIGNNNTIAMDRSSLQQLPKNQAIQMSVTQYYLKNGIEYIARDSFVLLVQKSDLIPVIKYPKVINLRERQLILDASQSYDPQANETGTTNVPVVCKWICPSYLSQICSQATITSNSCIMTFDSSTILGASNYYSAIANQAHLFTLNITKDTRLHTSYVYVTFIDSNFYPKCQIDFLANITINSYAFLNATCYNQSQAFTYTYSWSIYQWKSQISLDLISNLPGVQQSTLRIPPYLFSSQSAVLIILQVSNGTYTTPINWYQEINDRSQFTQGTITPNFNQFSSYLSPFTITPANWDSTASSVLKYQYRIMYEQGSFSKFKLLLSPTVASASNPISSILPPITFENQIYYDVIDTDSNYFTLKQAILSQPNIVMSAATFQARVLGIISTVSYTFSETDFELSTIKLMLYYQAFRQGYVNMTGVPISYFRSLSEQTVNYLYNAIIIDQRLSSITSYDRALLVRQNLVELLSYIAMSNQDITNGNSFMILLNSILQSGEIYIAHSFEETCMRVYISVHLISQFTYFTLGDQIIKTMQNKIQGFLYSDESILYAANGYSFYSYEIAPKIKTYPQIYGFLYGQDLIQMAKFIGGTFTLLRNDTFVLAQLYDSAKVPQLIQGLTTPVNATFYLSQVQVQRNQSGNLTFFCAGRQDNSQAWSSSSNRIAFTSYDRASGQIVCRSFILGQFALFITDLTLLSQTNTSVNLNNSQGDSNVSGQWNNTNNASTIYLNSEDLFIYDDQTVLIEVLAILTIVIFIASSFIIACIYDKEHQTIDSLPSKEAFKINANQDLRQNRRRLLIEILKNFNPYMNLFLIYNKFLKRWIRNSLLQIYFMTISLIFGINAALLSRDQSSLGVNNNGSLVGFFFLVILIILLSRPLAIKIMYRLLYEPLSRVENYQISLPTLQNIKNEKQQSPQIEDFEALEDFDQEKQKSNNKPVLVLPRFFSSNKVSKQKENQESQVASLQLPSMAIDNQQHKSSFQFGSPDSSLHQANDETGEMKNNQSSYIEEVKENLNNFEAYSPKRQISTSIQLDFPSQNPIFQNQSNLQQELQLDPSEIETGRRYQSMLPPINQQRQNQSLIFEMPDTDLQIEIQKPERMNKKLKNKRNQSRNAFSEEDRLSPKSTRRTNLNVIQDLPSQEDQSEESKLNQNFEQENPTEELPALNVDDHRKEEDFSKFHLPEINIAKGIMVQGQPQNIADIDILNPQISQIDNDDGFNAMEDFFQTDSQPEPGEMFEGGEHESYDSENKPSNSPNDQNVSIEDQQHTNMLPNTMLHTNFYNPRDDEIDNYHPHNQVSFTLEEIDNEQKRSAFEIQRQNSKLLRPQSLDFQLKQTQKQSAQEQEVLFQKRPKEKRHLFIKKHFGKIALMTLWVGLAIANIICIENMRRKYFNSWLILTLISFFSVLLVFDPLIYYGASCILISQQITKEIDFQIKSISLDQNGREILQQLYLIAFIGKEKMLDLRRNLGGITQIEESKPNP